MIVTLWLLDPTVKYLTSEHIMKTSFFRATESYPNSRGICLLITEPLSCLLTHVNEITFIINPLLYNISFFFFINDKNISVLLLLPDNVFHWHRPFTQCPQHYPIDSNILLVNTEGLLRYTIPWPVNMSFNSKVKGLSGTNKISAESTVEVMHFLR